LDRFRHQANPLGAIDVYLAGVYREAVARGYSFDPSKTDLAQTCAPLPVTDGQVSYEWQHLLQKLAARNPALFEQWRRCDQPDCHPLFVVCPGPVAPWERPPGTAGTSGR